VGFPTPASGAEDVMDGWNVLHLDFL